MRNKGVTHSQAILTEDSEEALGMQEGYLEHSSGHTGNLALSEP